jgi:hypothetical protein
VGLRVVLALLAFGVLFHPDRATAAAIGVVVLAGTAGGVWRYRQIAAPKAADTAATPAASPSGGLAAMLSEARREV